MRYRKPRVVDKARESSLEPGVSLISRSANHQEQADTPNARLPGSPSPRPGPSTGRSPRRRVDPAHVGKRVLDGTPCCERDLNRI